MHFVLGSYSDAVYTMSVWTCFTFVLGVYRGVIFNVSVGVSRAQDFRISVLEGSPGFGYDMYKTLVHAIRTRMPRICGARR